MNIQKLMAMGASLVIALAAAAQVAVPPCCKYLWEWPAEENPNGACAGLEATSCQTGAQNVWGEDPMARMKRLWVEAKCFLALLESPAAFYRQDCSDEPPAGGHFIGVLPNGQCCYAVGPEHNLEIVPLGTGYWVRDCIGNCNEYQN
ncbi:MAG: hypothetical protein KJZ65_13515 [Phycisphaerales bacterium]|nr:hypothetical protein [Phycisphaerales bacterium]